MMLWAMVMAAVPAQAQGAASQPPIEELRSCRAVARGEDRLACYDRAADALLRAQRDKDIVVLDRAQVRQAKRSLFGFSLPSVRLFGDGDDGEGGDGALKQVTGRLRSSAALPGGLVRFALDDGGTWEATEQAMSPPRPGDTVTIKAGALGSYVATAPGRRAVRVRRVR